MSSDTLEYIVASMPIILQMFALTVQCGCPFYYLIGAITANVALEFVSYCINNFNLFVFSHLSVDRQQNCVILSPLRFAQLVARLMPPITRFTMRTHDPAACRDTLVEQILHNPPLIDAIR